MDTASLGALMLAVIAGLSTIIGALIVILTHKRSDALLSGALGLASGVMISAALLDMLPEAIEYFSTVSEHVGRVHENAHDHYSELIALGFMAVGIAVSIAADKLIPHKCGIEWHGHGHGHGHDHEHGESCGNDPEVKWLGIVSMLAIALHNLPEGIALYLAGYNDFTLGITLCVAIVLHNIPGGITIAMPVYYSSGSKLKALLCTLIPSLVQPLGALLACFVFKSFMSDFFMGAMFAIVAGLLLVVSLVELYPMSQRYHHRTAGSIAIFIGVLIMPLTHMLSH